jgi:hypothetical protein
MWDISDTDGNGGQCSKSSLYLSYKDLVSIAHPTNRRAPMAGKSIINRSNTFQQESPTAERADITGRVGAIALSTRYPEKSSYRELLTVGQLFGQ